jgi:hypothetical protein
MCYKICRYTTVLGEARWVWVLLLDLKGLRLRWHASKDGLFTDLHATAADTWHIGDRGGGGDTYCCATEMGD